MLSRFKNAIYDSLMFIAIEGCFGVGKTTVATALAAHRNKHVILENFEANPFLSAFYQDPIQSAFETEFAFLLLHYHQLKPHMETARTSEVIADFHLGKDLIYADLNLRHNQEKRLFRDLYDLCTERTPNPGFMILLSASTDLLVERIRSRNRNIEAAVNPLYCDKLNAAYDHFFAAYNGAKLRVDMNDWDFVKDPSLILRLSLLIDRELRER